jgi:hypothetical protein
MKNGTTHRWKHLKKFKQTLEKSIVCSSLENFEKVIKKLNSLGYESKGTPLYNVYKSKSEWNRGMRVINLYDDKEVKFCLSDKNLKNVVKDIDFLKNK